MWSINVRFLRGVCVATSTGQWDESEWPPHPARLFMAMAAAYFETRPIQGQVVERNGPNHDQWRAALCWLERQPAPSVIASEAAQRDPVTVFVPVNDSTSAKQLLSEARSRQPRYFPTRIPNQDVVSFAFEGELDLDYADDLESIAREVVRVGHSSSLTQVWLERDFEMPTAQLDDGTLNLWQPANSGEENEPLRIFSEGMLDGLETAYNEHAVNQYAQLQEEIRLATSREKRALKALLEEQFPDGQPVSLRPDAAMTTGYQKTSTQSQMAAGSCFDSDMMILAFHDAPQMGLESTLQLSGSVRKRIHDAYPNRTSPEWLGGHKPDGSRSSDPHVAIVPLPFVGGEHGDGHLLGLAMVFPMGIKPTERAIALRAMFERSDDIDDWVLSLRLHGFRRLTEQNQACDITLVREQRLSPPQALQVRTWTDVSTVWETVTPIVLDRFPKRDRSTERQAWLEEVASIVSQSCVNIGLPEPSNVHIHHNAFVRGVPKSRTQGGGFPVMKAREGKPSRYQVHARIQFSTPVRGPVLLGAGRFLGYGLCRPNLRLCRKLRGL